MASAARRIPRPFSDRSIRVLVSPTPISFAERRSVLQVLEQHGAIEVFKMTQGYHSNFISVTRDAATASKLIHSSPLRYELSMPRVSADVRLADLGTAEDFKQAMPSPTVRRGGADASHGPEDGTKRPAEPPSREFRLGIYPEPDYKHEHTMTSSLLHGTWPESYTREKSFMAVTLAQTLPRTVAAEGLAHWDNDPDVKVRESWKERRLQLQRWMPSRMRDKNAALPNERRDDATVSAGHIRATSETRQRGPSALEESPNGMTKEAR